MTLDLGTTCGGNFVCNLANLVESCYKSHACYKRPFSLYVSFSQFRPRDVLQGILWGTITRSEMEKMHKSQQGLLCVMSVLLQQARTSSIPTSFPQSLLVPSPGVKEKRTDPGNKVGTIHFPVGAAVCRLHYHHMISYKILER